MFTVTEKAATMIKDYLAKQEGPRNVIRLLSQPG